MPGDWSSGRTRHFVCCAVLLVTGPLVNAHGYNSLVSNHSARNFLQSILSAPPAEFAGGQRDESLERSFGTTNVPAGAFQQKPSFLSTASRLRAGVQEDTVSCRVYFEGPTSEPPTLSVESSSTVRGPFLVIFRDTFPAANGWIHGFERAVSPGHTGPFGAGDGEYARVHPPSGVHTYEMLIFDKNYELGPSLTALKGTPWNNPARALGPEEKIVDDLASALAPGSPRPDIIGRCSVSVSHAELEAEEHAGK